MRSSAVGTLLGRLVDPQSASPPAGEVNWRRATLRVVFGRTLTSAMIAAARLSRKRASGRVAGADRQEDVLTPVSQSIEMAELIPNARLQVLPRGGHGMAVEYTAETVAAITAFLGAAASAP
jgi:pimeloyl-ACP methyl ester carboxylesterase